MTVVLSSFFCDILQMSCQRAHPSVSFLFSTVCTCCVFVSCYRFFSFFFSILLLPIPMVCVAFKPLVWPCP
ncbi:hypothetical protein BZA77DRAFT_96683 [Pyronema omphalodes]|nr:hypothetical protein BZA77DRAFT_96683 [Pyronema omphalodes]